jgi:hypothetical protein
MSASSQRWVRSAQVAFRQIGDECLLVPIRTSPDQEMSIFSLNGAGAFIWKALEGPLSRAELVGQMLAQFDVDAATAATDVGGFLGVLKARRLVEALEE